ncbi:uncharacterized protein N7511_002348 [Penicillium nucicola]|uniref:uncharacterized protein n=1 Tax=Penicillium nucicola TaxID=1850975 RepID=UPI0025454E25|nr:uncharacterized protein N7511_002348 [Penicillium nucicola]KAJ5770297.1 hypothetical protein N7511_002348 [Penicillium nucicola]
MSSQSPKNRGTSVFRRKDAPIAPGNGFDHNKKRMNRSNPLPAPGRSIDAPGINLDYNKKRNNWSSSSAAPGAFSAFVGSSPAPGRTHMSTRAPGTHFDHNKKRTNESNSAPGGFGATGTDPDYNKKRKNWSGNQRNQVPHHRNHNTGYNHNRNSGPNNCVHSEYTVNATPIGAQETMISETSPSKIKTTIARIKNTIEAILYGATVKITIIFEDEEMPDAPHYASQSKQKPKTNNSKQPNKFQSTFHDVDPDIDMQDAPSDEQNDIEMVDAPPLIPDNDPVSEIHALSTLNPHHHSLSTVTNELRAQKRIKAFTQGVHALQHIVHSMVNVAAQIDTSILQNEYCTA